MDSLYKGFPVGYIIVWKNPDIRLKDGKVSSGKKILIDGQQRITAIQAAIVGQEVVDSTYKKKRIVIAFNPIEEVFEVYNPAIEKDVKWISDISEVFDVGFDAWEFVNKYCEANGMSGKQSEINKKLMRLTSIKGINPGVTELSQALTIDEVTDIFIRINSQGVVLSQADFAMSKISSDDRYGGNETRKMIDYFCHFMQRPADYEMIVANDKDLRSLMLCKRLSGLQRDRRISTFQTIRMCFVFPLHIYSRGAKLLIWSTCSPVVTLKQGRILKA